MNTWAIVKTGGKQYKVEEGKTIVVEKLDGEKNTRVTFDQVLAVGSEKQVLGSPYIKMAKVKGKILETFRDDKVRVVKFKRKSRYTRTQGHRQAKTRVLIEKIIL